VNPDGEALLFLTSYIGRDGSAAGVGAAANAADGQAVAIARSSVDNWSDTLRTRRVLRATADPLCPGAHRALGLAGQAASAGPVHVYGILPGHQGTDLVPASDLAEVPPGARVLFPAHGVSVAIHAEAAARGLRIIDATCPLTDLAQASVRSFADNGDTVIVIGREGQASTEGLIGQAPERVIFAETTADLPDQVTGRVSYVLQPGVPVEELAPVASEVRLRYQARGTHPDGWCYAASDRIASVRAVAAESDVMIILGHPDSPDSIDLVKLTADTPVHVITDATEIRPEWIATAGTIGLAETVTTRPGAADAVITALSGIGPLAVTERHQVSQTTTGYTHPAHDALHSPVLPPATTASRSGRDFQPSGRVSQFQLERGRSAAASD